MTKRHKCVVCGKRRKQSRMVQIPIFYAPDKATNGQRWVCFFDSYFESQNHLQKYLDQLYLKYYQTTFKIEKESNKIKNKELPFVPRQ